MRKLIVCGLLAVFAVLLHAGFDVRDSVGGHALLLMLAYYTLKTVREPLLLTDSSAEFKSYAYALTALLLLLVVPIVLLQRYQARDQEGTA